MTDLTPLSTLLLSYSSVSNDSKINISSSYYTYMIINMLCEVLYKLFILIRAMAEGYTHYI